MHRVIKHLAGNTNPADGPSRWPDYEIGYEIPTAQLVATLAAVESYDLLPAFKTAQATGILATDVSKKIVDIPMVGYSGLTERQSGGWNAAQELETRLRGPELWREDKLPNQITNKCEYDCWSSLQSCNSDHWWAGWACWVFTRNCESSSASTLERMVSITG